MSLFGKDLICTQDWTLNELTTILQTAILMKQDRFHERWTSLLKNRNFLMLFYSPSIRTHLSFLTAATELGGHAQYMEPNMGRIKMYDRAGETIEDIANVVSGYMAGVGIRMMEGSVKNYRDGHNLIREFAEHASIPVINMADDVCHPCQGLSDILGWAEWFSKDSPQIDFSRLKGKRLLLTWGKGSLARSWNSPQEGLLIASRFGLDITVARPAGYDFDEDIYEQVRENCELNDQQFNVIDDPNSGYADADIVYSRHWISSNAYMGKHFNREEEIEMALSGKHAEWITTKEKMEKTNQAIFTHPMPIDRNFEVEDAVVNSNKSILYNIAHNRLHIQKSIMAHTMVEMNYNLPWAGRRRSEKS